MTCCCHCKEVCDKNIPLKLFLLSFFCPQILSFEGKYSCASLVTLVSMGTEWPLIKYFHIQQMYICLDKFVGLRSWQSPLPVSKIYKAENAAVRLCKFAAKSLVTRTTLGRIILWFNIEYRHSWLVYFLIIIHIYIMWHYFKRIQLWSNTQEIYTSLCRRQCSS